MKHEQIEQFEISHLVLRRAREMIDKEGWCKHTTWVDRDGRIYRCAGFALVAAANELGVEDFEARQLLIAAMGPPWCIPIWNDKKHRTKAQVLAAFDKALS